MYIFLYREIGFPHKCCKMVIQDSGSSLTHLLELILQQWNDASCKDNIGGRSWKNIIGHLISCLLVLLCICICLYVCICMELGWEGWVSEINCGEIYWLFLTFPPPFSAYVLKLQFFLLLRNCATAFPEILGVARILKKLQLSPPSALLFTVSHLQTPKCPVFWWIPDHILVS